jgi:hypothetical protein
MKVLKTIVATAVIVFALTTVAMAGVQHFTKAQSAQATGKAPVRYTVTLTAQQLAHLINDRAGSQTAPAKQRTATHARGANRQHGAAHQARHQAHAQHLDRSPSNGQSTSSGHSGSHHYEPSYHTQTSGNGHSGDYGDGGGQCGD